ncbi:hypothetical protein OF83DRAFT_1042606, partial [Amylostereum chailletii]
RLTCEFCKKSGHEEKTCYQKQIKDLRSHLGDKANAASSSSDGFNPTSEHAGSAASASVAPSDSLSPLQLDADINWNANTGATSHMTPYRHFFTSYRPLCMPIHLADGKTVYSAGVSSVVFNPVV